MSDFSVVVGHLQHAIQEADTLIGQLARQRASYQKALEALTATPLPGMEAVDPLDQLAAEPSPVGGDTTTPTDNGETAAPQPPPHGTPDPNIIEILRHPDRIEHAVRTQAGWVRDDRRKWECSCGKKLRSIAYLHQHIARVTKGVHHPLITAIIPNESNFRTNHVSFGKPEVGAIVSESGTADGETAQSVEKPTDDLSVGVASNSPTRPLKPGQPDNTPKTHDLPDIRPTRDEPPDDGLPFACSCDQRFATARDWSQHRHNEPVTKVSQHRLVRQPAAIMVDPGVKYTRPAVEALRHAAYTEGEGEAATSRDYTYGRAI